MRNGQAVVEGVNGGGGWSEYGGFVLRSAEDDAEEICRKLVPGEVHRAAWRGVKLPFLHVADDGNNFDLLLHAHRRDLFSNGILTREILPRHLLIDNDDRRMGGVVRVGEPPAAEDARLERGEVVWAHIAVCDLAMNLSRRRADNGKTRGTVIVAKRKTAGQCDRLHTRKS